MRTKLYNCLADDPIPSRVLQASKLIHVSSCQSFTCCHLSSEVYHVWWSLAVDIGSVTACSHMLTSCPPFSLVSKMASHSSKNKIASLILASLKMNLKFSPALMLPSEGKLISGTYEVQCHVHACKFMPLAHSAT